MRRPSYRNRQDYKPGELVPLVLDTKDLGLDRRAGATALIRARRHDAADPRTLGPDWITRARLAVFGAIRGGRCRCGVA